jgi:predicted DsbA family dithiol-disulfide isomerase
MAVKAGLDAKQFKQALDARTHAPELQARSATAHNKHFWGAPSIQINNYRISGMFPLSRLRRTVDLALEEAKQAQANEAAPGSPLPPSTQDKKMR